MLLIRHAVESDLERTYQIKKSAIGPYVELLWGWNEADQLAFHRRSFNPAETEIILDDSGNAIGFLRSAEDECRINIAGLFIERGAQDKHVGTAVLTRLILKAKLGSKRIELQVFKINQRARAFYERLGFQIAGQTELHYILILFP